MGHRSVSRSKSITLTFPKRGWALRVFVNEENHAKVKAAHIGHAALDVVSP